MDRQKPKMKLGMICRMDNSGLGTLSWEFARHLKPDKVLLVEHEIHANFPERYEDFETKTISRHTQIGTKDWSETLDWFFSDIDVVFSAETFYDWSLIPKARKAGVKTVLYTMYEMTPEKMPYYPDLLLCPSKLDYDVFKDYLTRVEYLPVPVATDKLRWVKREKAKTFIHPASHTGMNFRKGTKLLLDAIPLVKSDVKFRIFTWHNVFETKDPRCEVEVVNFKNYWQLWREGDVLVYPQDYNGICLPVIEAMSCGLAVITTDIYPFNEYMPRELMFQPEEMYTTRAANRLIETEAARIDPKAIAEKIDEWANRDISKFSEYGRDWAVDNSWLTLLPKYTKLLESVQ